MVKLLRLLVMGAFILSPGQGQGAGGSKKEAAEPPGVDKATQKKDQKAQEAINKNRQKAGLIDQQGNRKTGDDETTDAAGVGDQQTEAPDPE